MNQEISFDPPYLNNLNSTSQEKSTSILSDTKKGINIYLLMGWGFNYFPQGNKKLSVSIIQKIAHNKSLLVNTDICEFLKDYIEIPV